METGTVNVKRGLAQMLKGGVIMDVVTPEQAKIAEDAGACAVMGPGASAGGHPRPTEALLAWPIQPLSSGSWTPLTIPVMVKCRIGHFVEAQILEALGVGLRRRVGGPDPRG